MPFEEVKKIWMNGKIVDFADAKKATDLLASGEEAEPKGFDRHPAAVRAIARRFHQRHVDDRPRYVDGQETVQCRRCQDSGFVTIWHHQAMEAARDGTLTGANSYKAAAACDCSAGDRHRDIARFNPRTMLAYVPRVSLEEERRDLVDFVKSIQSARVKGEPWKP